jgi:hypothetical protein
MPPPLDVDRQSLEWMLDTEAVRAAAERVHSWVLRGKSKHFTLDERALERVARSVAELTLATYPSVAAIPYHSRYRHFGAGGVDRRAILSQCLEPLPALERLRSRIDLVVTSVLLDAGAGPDWKYRETDSGKSFTRSEGLAIASWHWFVTGGFSNDPRRAPLRADARALERVDAGAVSRAFRVTAQNPLVGLDGRAALLARLGKTVAAGGPYFPGDARPGSLGDYLLAQAKEGLLPASTLASAVIRAFAPIWPGREKLGDTNLGDVWRHSQLGLVPFHKLSQWLAYSLVEPLEEAGVKVWGLDHLTGLPEYRNGGLFIDTGVILPKHDAVLTQPHRPDSDLIIEWRALTVALLDRTAQALRTLWQLEAGALPLAKVLEGGTWALGRRLAQQKRSGTPPIQIESDGTVF